MQKAEVGVPVVELVQPRARWGLLRAGSSGKAKVAAQFSLGRYYVIKELRMAACGAAKARSSK